MLSDDNFEPSQEYYNTHTPTYFKNNSVDGFMINDDMLYDRNQEYDMYQSEHMYDAWQQHMDEHQGVTVDYIVHNDGRIQELFDIIIKEAIAENANNIAIDEHRDFGLVRIAYGQKWHNYRLIQKSSVLPLVTYIKYRAGLNYQLDDRNEQQTQGRIKYQDTFFRTYTGRDFYGDYANLRLLDSDIIKWEQLNLPNRISVRLENRVFKQNSRMLLVGGPTGSGKSTTLNAILEHIVRHSGSTMNIYSVESPIEVALPGVIQIEANERYEGQRYEDIISGILRGQPNIIRINEISTKPTAQAALRAAASGVTSMATLHMNSAVDVFETLRNYDVSENDIKNSLGEILYMQRPPMLCSHCRKPWPYGTDDYTWTSRNLADGNDQRLTSFYRRNPEGCEYCRKANLDPSMYGYLGQISVYEYLEVNRPMLRIWRQYKQFDSYVLKNALMHPSSVHLDDARDTVSSDIDQDGRLTGIVYFPIEEDLLDKMQAGYLDIETVKNIINN